MIMKFIYPHPPSPSPIRRGGEREEVIRLKKV